MSKTLTAEVAFFLARIVAFFAARKPSSEG
jgi:hypothetical protein